MYLALARKYRPQTFADLIGQNSISKTLQNAIQMNKVYPAMIFSGMKGVGKTSTARILAKALNCETGPAIEPCNQCQTCREITDDVSADYLEIDGASNNGVNEVRSLRETVKYKPLKNRYRIVVIDEVHMLSGAAWNALLKTVEEPPEHTFFIMATTDFHKIPATIVSRCQHYEFKRIPLEVIKSVLEEICGKEDVKISDYSLYLIAKAGEGSLRDAKKVLDQAIALSNGDIKDHEVVEILGIIDEEIFIDITRSVLTQDRQGIIEQIARLTERGTDLRFFYNEYMKFMRDLLILKSLENSEKLHGLNPENVGRIRDMLKNVGEIELLRYFNTLKEMEQTIKNTENPLVITEFLFLKLSFFPFLIPIENALQQIRNDPSGRAPVTSAAPNVPPRAMAPAGGAVTDRSESRQDNDFFERLNARIEQEKPRLASIIRSSNNTLTNDRIRVEVPGEMLSAVKMAEEHMDFIAETAGDIAGKKMSVEIVRGDKKKSKDHPDRIEKLRGDKIINSLRETIKGKLVAIENINGGKDE